MGLCLDCSGGAPKLVRTICSFGEGQRCRQKAKNSLNFQEIAKIQQKTTRGVAYCIIYRSTVEAPILSLRCRAPSVVLRQTGMTTWYSVQF